MAKGRFGIYGGQYIPETLMNEIMHLEERYEFFKKDPAFNRELEGLLRDYAGRPSLLYFAEKMTRDLGGARIYLKREDLNHTGSHKINNVLGQVLMAKKMGKTRVIAETGAGQHGVACATAAALLAPRIQKDRRSTSTAWSFWAPRSMRSRAARRPSRTRSMRPCGNGRPGCMTLIMCWAP